MSPSKLRLLLLLAAVAMFGCASTQKSSRTLPGYEIHPYNKIMIEARMNMLARERTEHRMMEAMKNYTVDSCASIDIFFPGKTYSPEETAATLLEHGVGGVLVIQLEDAWTEHSTSATYYSTSVSTYVAVSDVDKPHAVYTADFFDLSTGDRVWTGYLASAGNKWADQSNLRDSVCDEVVKDLMTNVISAQRKNYRRGARPR